MRIPRSLAGMLVLAAGAAPLAGRAADSQAAVTIPSPVPFAPDFEISEDARAECGLGETQATELTRALSSLGYEVSTQEAVKESAAKRVLLLEFGSGKSTGHALDSFNERTNYLVLKGCLYDSGAVVATFIDTRFSTGGVGGEFRKTCSILHKIEAALANDVAKWLANEPPMFASLGDGAGAKVALPAGTKPFCMMYGKLPAEYRTKPPAH